MKEYKYKINGNLYKVTINNIEDNIAEVEVNGTPFKVEMDKPAKAASPTVTPVSRPATATVAPATPVERPAATASSGSASRSAVKSPHPGVSLDIKVQGGREVKKGQTLLILEAMKMENTINADKDGKVAEIKINKGDSVLEGADLVIIE